MVHKRGGSDSDIVFPDGHKDSAISYSLSQSYMNVSYLFMSNTETVLSKYPSNPLGDHGGSA
jgi:hypothetical protein